MVAIASLPNRSLPTTDAGGRRGLVVVPSPFATRHSSGVDRPGQLASSPAARLAAGLLLALAIVAGLLYLATTPGVTGATPTATSTSHVVVEGETMWSIAVDNAPAGEAAGYVERLVAANGAVVAAGDVLVLPLP